MLTNMNSLIKNKHKINMKTESKIKELINSLDDECNEIKQMIITRIESMDESQLVISDLLEDPFSLDISFYDTELDQFHVYDISRYEAFKEISRELKRILKSDNNE